MRPTLLNKFIVRFIVMLFAVIPVVGLGQTTYSTPGANTYTVPAGVTCVQVQIWGGGGAGGSNNTTANGSGGGGGGGYTFSLVSVSPGQIINLFVGSGGQPVVAGGTGGDGENSWFVTSGSYFAGGGGGGQGNGSTGGGIAGSGATYNGGAGGGGRSNTDGDAGGGGSSAGTGSNGTAGNPFGGSSPGGTAVAPTGGGNGGAGGAGGNGNDGVSGSAPGGGGGGGGDANGANVGIGGAGGNGQIIVTAVNICDTYCTSSFSSGAAGRITNVTFNTLNNPSGAWVSPGYTNYTSSSCTQVTQGQSFTITVALTLTGAYSHSVVAWFDWNGDGTFSATEQITIGTTSASGNVSTSVSIPCNSVPGKTVFRVLAQYTGTPAACGSATYGESEDYCVEIIATVPPVSNAGTDQNITCASSATLDASASTPAPASGFWTLISGTGTITSPTSPTSGITGMSNGANVFQWTEQGTCENSTDLVTINVSGLPDVPVTAGDDIFSCTQGLSLGGSDPTPFVGQWVVISGPNTPTFTPDINTSNAQVSAMINGTYVLQWQVNAGACGIISDQMTFTFGSLPTPNAGPDQTICPTGAVLNGNDFSGATGTWSVFSGPAGSGFVNVNDPNTTIYGLVPGSYVLRWTVSGGGCAGGTFDAMTITVNACTTAVTHSTSTDQTFTGCQYTYTDNGGSGANYSNGIAQTWTTFCPDDPNDFATLTLTAANFSNGDYITIYDENGPASPIIASYWFDPSPGGGMVLNPPLGTTITSSTGCLYVQMNSTAATNTSGWTSTVGCSSTAGTQSQQFVTVNNCGGGGGITLCGNGSIPAIAGGATNPPDLGGANSGCLGSQEGASNTWVYMTAETDGYIAFEISPAGGQDFDYAIWGPYDGGYACPGSTLDDPLRCSWAANGGAGCPADIGLGIIDATGGSVLPNDVSETGTCTATNEGWTYPILASAGDVYVLLFQNYSYNNSTFGVTINTDPSSIPPGGSFATLGCTPPQPLPIELISFVGEHKDRVNKLYWNCASEFENDYFTIERSVDGKNWSQLAIIDGAGYSQSLTHYSTVDSNPYAGINYYRLVQTDFNGKKRSYKTIALSTEIEIEDMFSNIFPNPTQNSFYFNYGGKDFESEIIVNIYNSTGQLVINESFLEFNSSQSMEINTIDLVSGFYHVEIIQNGKKEVKKLSILK